MSDYREILESIGYSLTDDGKNYRTKPLYRDSDSNTVLSIDKNNGQWYDFKTAEGGSFERLIQITMNIPSGQVSGWLEQKNFMGAQSLSAEVSPKIIIEDTIFDEGFVKNLEEDSSYWEKRNIKPETLKVFKGGVCKAGKMKNRYVFPILNNLNQIIGASGRLIFPPIGNVPKWKNLGQKKSWAYPSTLNTEEIKNKNHVIIVESIGDMLSLWQNGVKTALVSFGLDIQPGLLNYLIKLDVKKIIIAFNNDEQNKNAGNIAAEKQKRKLLRYFDPNQVFVSLPHKKDFGEMSSQEITEWKIKTKNICLHQG